MFLRPPAALEKSGDFAVFLITGDQGRERWIFQKRAEYHNQVVRNLKVRRVQCDEIWAFVYAKQKNVTKEQMEKGAGDCWTWTAIDADSKLIISYALGDRGAATAHALQLLPGSQEPESHASNGSGVNRSCLDD